MFVVETAWWFYEDNFRENDPHSLPAFKLYSFADACKLTGPCKPRCAGIDCCRAFAFAHMREADVVFADSVPALSAALAIVPKVR